VTGLRGFGLPASSFTVTSHASLPGEFNPTDEIICPPKARIRGW
jgi:hypothetical protein